MIAQLLSSILLKTANLLSLSFKPLTFQSRTSQFNIQDGVLSMENHNSEKRSDLDTSPLMAQIK
jgi:hypothetical protein